MRGHLESHCNAGESRNAIAGVTATAMLSRKNGQRELLCIGFGIVNSSLFLMWNK